MRLVDGKLAPVLQGCTSLDGIGAALVLNKEDGEINDGTRVGVLDGYGEWGWLINPFAGGGGK